jgi:N-acyl-D-amino-acid deacylase
MGETGMTVIDIAIVGATIVDGSGAAPRMGTVLVKDGKVLEVTEGRAAPSGASRVIDATGLVAAPGFIDTHIHSDVDLLWNRQHAGTLMQGITTHILGQDGMSYAPLSASNLAAYRKYLAAVDGAPPIQWDWTSVAEFRERFDKTVAANTAYLVPHGTVRFEVAGMSPLPMRGRELAAACDLVRSSLAEGAVGLSTGLSYFPGSFSDTEELAALCEVAREFGRPYVSHLRSVFAAERFDPVDEALTLARRTGVKLHVSHYRTTPATIGRVTEVLDKLDRAFDDGLDVSLDTYPYLYGSGPLHIGLPPWAFEGGVEQTLERLADPALRPSLVRGIENNLADLDGRLTNVPASPWYEGRQLRDVAAERGQSIAELACDLLLENELDVTYHLGTDSLLADAQANMQFENDCLEVLDRPYSMVGSDGIYVGRNPHERAYGTFPKLLRLAREHGFALEKMVHRMTKAAAERFSLPGRGVLKEGGAADIVLFDPITVRERATPATPRRSPHGIEMVLVNGEIAVDNGAVTGIFGGRALRPSATEKQPARARHSSPASAEPRR